MSQYLAGLIFTILLSGSGFVLGYFWGRRGLVKIGQTGGTENGIEQPYFDMLIDKTRPIRVKKASHKCRKCGGTGNGVMFKKMFLGEMVDWFYVCDDCDGTGKKT